MQRRFCECGYHFWVHYLFENHFFTPCFWSSQASISRVSTCPHCGRHLDINTLR